MILKSTSLPEWSEQCFRSSCNRFWYYFIPKNASMSFRSIGLFQPQLVHYTYQPVDAISILILRNPYDRVISSYIWDIKHSITTDTFQEYIVDMNNGNFTPEAVPQSVYINSRKVNLDNITHIMVIDYLQQQFNDFKIKYNMDFLYLDSINSGNPHEKQAAQEILMQPKHKEIIQQVYKDDFDVYNIWLHKAKEQYDV